ACAASTAPVPCLSRYHMPRRYTPHTTFFRSVLLPAPFTFSTTGRSPAAPKLQRTSGTPSRFVVTNHVPSRKTPLSAKPSPLKSAQNGRSPCWPRVTSPGDRRHVPFANVRKP